MKARAAWAGLFLQRWARADWWPDWSAAFGEFVGYVLRLVSGRWADRSGRYWLITLLGYLVQMVAVPMLALAGSWQAAAALMVAERMGKAIRNPPRDVMLSEAGEVIGRGWAFGVNEALDQLGAFVGPITVAAVYAARQDYTSAFAWLAVPAATVLLLVVTARFSISQSGRDRARHGAGKCERLSGCVLVVCGGVGAGGIRLCRLFADRISFRQRQA